MCRVLAYMGEPILLDTLLYQADSALVSQMYDPKMLGMMSLAGFGMTAWDQESHDPDLPFTYKTSSLPVFDGNLRGLAKKLRPHSLLAHVRGVAYRENVIVGEQNLHPFRFDGFRLALAHNGDLAEFSRMKYDLLEHVRPEIAAKVRGTTDSEWIYALLMPQFEDPTKDLDAAEITRAVESTLRIIRRVRDRLGISTSSSINLFLCDGNDLVATRFTFDFGCYPEAVHEANLSYLSLWYTFGKEYRRCGSDWRMVGGINDFDSIIVASEPLTRDVSTWLEVPEYSMLYVKQQDGHRRIKTVELDA